MDQKQKQTEELCSINICKFKQNHLEKQTQELFQFFTDEYKYQDPLLLVGTRYKAKEKQFQAIRKQNQELKQKTRNLTSQLENLRNSLKDGQFKDQLKESIQQDFDKRHYFNSSYSLSCTYDETKIQIADTLKQINKRKNQARQDFKNYQKEFKERLNLFINQLQQQKKIQLMKNCNFVEKHDGQQILIPKDRYQRLLEFYEEKVIENHIKKAQQKFSSEKYKQKLKNIEEKDEMFYQKYSNIFQDQNVNSWDLQTLFRTLAKMTGFQQTWNRYKSKIGSQYEELKKKIKNIIKNYSSQNKKMGDNLTNILSQLIDSILFQDKQKKQFRQLKLTNQTIIKKMAKQKEQLEQYFNTKLKNNLAEIISISLRHQLKNFQDFLSEKLNKKINSDRDILQKISKEQISLSLKIMNQKDNDNQWIQNFEKILNQKSEIIKRYQRKHFVFISTNDLYKKTSNLK